MKEDKKLKEIAKAVPGGTMPLVGAKQHLIAAPGAEKEKTVSGTSPAQTLPKAPAAKETPETSPGTAGSGVSPGKTAAMPETLPAKSSGDQMPAQAATGTAPANNVPVQPGPFGVMPYMMQQIPVICCPYLMNLQCPMTYAMPFGAGPVPDNMMPYAGSGSMPALPGGPMSSAGLYQPYGMGALPSAGSQYYPVSGMNY